MEKDIGNVQSEVPLSTAAISKDTPADNEKVNNGINMEKAAKAVSFAANTLPGMDSNASVFLSAIDDSGSKSEILLNSVNLLVDEGNQSLAPDANALDGSASNSTLANDEQLPDDVAKAEWDLYAGSSTAMMDENTVSTKELPALEPDLQCLLLEDAQTADKVPLHVQQMLQHFKDDANFSDADLLCQLIYCVALEIGFVEATLQKRFARIIVPPTPTSPFQVENVLLLAQQRPKFQRETYGAFHSIALRNLVRLAPLALDLSPLLDAKLVCVVSGELMIVTLVITNAKDMPGKSVCLSLPRYVRNRYLPHDAQQLYNMSELSMILRDKMFVPIRNMQLELIGHTLYPSLNGLPVELYEMLFTYMNENQLKKLINVSKTFQHLVTHSRAWRDYGNLTDEEQREEEY